MLEIPLGGRVPRLQTALQQFGRDEEAELCEAAARQGSGEWNVQRLPVAASEGVLSAFPRSVPTLAPPDLLCSLSNVNSRALLRRRKSVASS